MASVPGDESSAGDVVRAFPERFYGYFMLNPTAEGAVSRARRAFEGLGLKGLCLFPAMLRFSVQDERLRPLYEMASEAPGRIVFVHMGVLTVGVRARLGLESRFDMKYSNPLDLHRVALEHPTTNFVVPHFGAGYFREALMLASLAPNVYIDTSSRQWLDQVPDPAAHTGGCLLPGSGCGRVETAPVRIRLFILPQRLAEAGVRGPVRGPGVDRTPGKSGQGHPWREPRPLAFRTWDPLIPAPVRPGINDSVNPQSVSTPER